ncbi:MAG: hypothetical protein HC769_03920 [Cyanobacteria bacterium CRU_2_1]|nr:hypothetical protein [Cyanobacteria bacterium CRU_2_1]
MSKLRLGVEGSMGRWVDECMGVWVDECMGGHPTPLALASPIDPSTPPLPTPHFNVDRRLVHLKIDLKI